MIFWKIYWDFLGFIGISLGFSGKRAGFFFSSNLPLVSTSVIDGSVRESLRCYTKIPHSGSSSLQRLFCLGSMTG